MNVSLKMLLGYGRDHICDPKFSDLVAKFLKFNNSVVKLVAPLGGVGYHYASEHILPN